MSERPRINVAVLAIGAIIVVPLVALLWSGFGKDPHEVPSVLVDSKAAPFTLVDLDGSSWSLEEHSGKFRVVNFWATWCEPCKEEYPAMQQAAKSYPDVAFVGVLFGDEPPAARALLARDTIPPSYPNLIDPGGRVAIDYGVAGVPETFFIDPAGVIKLKYPGPLTTEMLTQILGPPGNTP